VCAAITLENTKKANIKSCGDLRRESTAKSSKSEGKPGDFGEVKYLPGSYRNLRKRKKTRLMPPDNPVCGKKLGVLKELGSKHRGK